jgi:hypothetical protein
MIVTDMMQLIIAVNSGFLTGLVLGSHRLGIEISIETSAPKPPLTASLKAIILRKLMVLN